MKSFLLCSSFLVLLKQVTAQTEVFVFSGINKSHVSVKKTSYDLDTYASGYSWEGGVQIRHRFADDAVINSGLAVVSNSYIRNFLSGADVTIRYDYKPVFVGVPLNFGYQLSATKNVSVSFLAGATYFIGLGGKLTEVLKHDYPYIYQTSFNRHIRFGDEQNGITEGADFTRQQVSCQAGIEVGFRKLKLNFFYHHGISNIQPKSVAGYEVQRLNFTSLVLTYGLFRLAK